MSEPRYRAFVDLHVILRKGDEILLGRRINTGFGDGGWALPAGHLEDGESATAGAAREVEEEAGVSIDPTDLTLRHLMHHRTNTGRVAFFFEARRWRGEVANREPTKCAGWEWHPIDALPEPTVGYMAAALSHVRAGVAFSEGGWE